MMRSVAIVGAVAGFTVADSTMWTRPWTFAMNLTKGGPDKQPFEYACHEGNYGMKNMLSAARAAEK